MTAPELPGFLGALAPILDKYGYLAVFVLVLVEDFGVPAPGETVLIAAAIFAGAGQLNIVAVGVIGFIAAVIGDNIGFAIGHFGGRPLALRFGKYVFLTEKRLDEAERFFNRHGGKIIVIARFVEGLRQANGIIAGISGMHWRRFLAFNALGAALWVGLWVTLGYVAGDNITAIYDAISRYVIWVVIAIVVLLAAVVGWRLVRRRRGKRGADASVPPALGDEPGAADESGGTGSHSFALADGPEDGPAAAEVAAAPTPDHELDDPPSQDPDPPDPAPTPAPDHESGDGGS